MKRFVTNLIICLFLLSFWFSVSSLNFLFVCFGLVLLLLLCFWQNSFYL